MSDSDDNGGSSGVEAILLLLVGGLLLLAAPGLVASSMQLIATKDLTALLDAVERQDDFALVTRGVGLLETAMNEALAKAFIVDHSLYDGIYIPWASLVRFCAAAGMFSKPLLHPLLRLGELRNQYAHEHGFRAEGSKEYKRFIASVRGSGSSVNIQDKTVAQTLYELMSLLGGVLDLELTAFLKNLGKLPDHPSNLPHHSDLSKTTLKKSEDDEI